MKSVKDSFGHEVHEGDIVVSAAKSSGNLKIGVAYYTKGGCLYIKHLTEAGHFWSKYLWDKQAWRYKERDTPLRTPAGTNVIILRKADGSLTETMEALFSSPSG